MNYELTKHRPNLEERVLGKVAQLLSDFATDDDDVFYKPGSSNLFGGVVEELSDSFARDGRDFFHVFFAVTLGWARKISTRGEELNTYLSRFGLYGKDEILERVDRIRNRQMVFDHTARDRLAPSRVAPVKLASVRSAPLRLLSCRLALVRFAPARVAPRRLEPPRLAPVRSAPIRLALCRLSPWRLA